MRVTTTVAIGAAASLISLTAATTAAFASAAAPAPNSAATCGGQHRYPFNPDFNGDGKTDYVVGIPGDKHGTGALEVVLRGDKQVVYRPGTHGIPAMSIDSLFGSATAAADINGDKCDDLLVGVPGLDVNGMNRAGGVQILFGTKTGFVAGPLITQGSDGAPGTPEELGGFGTSIFANTLDTESGVPLSVGVPGATVLDGADALNEAGEVVKFDVSDVGAVEPSVGEYQIQTMATGPQIGAHYGTIVADGLVTAPNASDGTTRDCGYIELLRQGFYGRAAGDHLGTSVAVGPASVAPDDLFGLFVGAPGHAIGSHAHAGAVEWFDWNVDGGGSGYSATITQADKGVPGKVRTDARFGESVATNATGSNWVVSIGAPGQQVGSKTRAGAVYSRRYVESGPGYVGKTWTTITQNTAGVPGSAQHHAGFGAALTTLNSPLRLIVGIPRAHKTGKPPSGAVAVLPVTAKRGVGTTGVNLLWRVDHPAAADQFGAWLEGSFAL